MLTQYRSVLTVLLGLAKVADEIELHSPSFTLSEGWGGGSFVNAKMKERVLHTPALLGTGNK